MKHIVERILDGLPVFIKEDFPRFVELLRAYYTWQAGPNKTLNTLYNHDHLLNIHRNGMGRSIEELDESAVPPQFRPAWKMFARQFNASRGSTQSWHDFFSIFFNSEVVISDASGYVFQPSAARVERYARCIVRTNETMPRSGVLLQPINSASADIVESSLLSRRGTVRHYEVTVKRRGKEFYPGIVKVITPNGIVTGEFACFQRFTGVLGYSYRQGDSATVSTALVTSLGTVATLQPAIVTSISVIAGGTGYSLGDVVGMVGSRGFRGEVAAVDGSGSILAARIIDRGDPFPGQPSFTVDTLLGVGASLSFVGLAGRPATLSFPAPIWGDVVNVTIKSTNGEDIQATWEGYVFEPVIVKTGFNGVVGSGTKITDSAAWMDSSYTVTTPVGRELWKEFATTMLHQPGRYMNAVKAVKGTANLLPSLEVVSTLRRFSSLSTGMSAGSSTAFAVTRTVTISTNMAAGENLTANAS